MNYTDDVLKNDEKAIYALRGLYRQYGYTRYKVGKFEEYDLYAHNKSFLISENILTFTDTDGKLMALKPDVTLSIIKNIRSDDTSSHKLYYNENVYRTVANSGGFHEIMQTGLECIGNIGAYEMCEVVMLAQKSLEMISGNYILDLSHMGFIIGLLDECGIENTKRSEILGYFGMKNAPAVEAFCHDSGISAENTEKLVGIASLYEPIEKGIEKIGNYVSGDRMKQAYEELKQISEGIAFYGLQDRLYLDFSVVNDMDYYNGIIFRGFVDGIPSGILSGGRYDSLMQKMGKKSGAVGFAVYLDQLEKLENDNEKYDVDVLLLYDGDVSTNSIINAVRKFNGEGLSVKAVNGTDSSVKYRKCIRVTDGGVQTLETDD